MRTRVNRRKAFCENLPVSIATSFGTVAQRRSVGVVCGSHSHSEILLVGIFEQNQLDIFGAQSEVGSVERGVMGMSDD